MNNVEGICFPFISSESKLIVLCSVQHHQYIFASKRPRDFPQTGERAKDTEVCQSDRPASRTK